MDKERDRDKKRCRKRESDREETLRKLSMLQVSSLSRFKSKTIYFIDF